MQLNDAKAQFCVLSCVYVQNNDALTSVSAGSLSSVGGDFDFSVSESCRYMCVFLIVNILCEKLVVCICIRSILIL